MTYPRKILFVCLHGSAKSLIAATHLRRLAAERGLLVEAASAGLEPDAEVPIGVAAGLRRDGLDVAGCIPQPVTTEGLQGADLVVTFGCAVPLLSAQSPRPTVLSWDGVPTVSEDYEAARSEIVRRIVALIDVLPA